VGQERRAYRVGLRGYFTKEDTMIAEFARTLDGLKEKLHILRDYL
jgi:hypothetical protein